VTSGIHSVERHAVVLFGAEDSDFHEANLKAQCTRGANAQASCFTAGAVSEAPL
jgi:hypothetical protein